MLCIFLLSACQSKEVVEEDSVLFLEQIDLPPKVFQSIRSTFYVETRLIEKAVFQGYSIEKYNREGKRLMKKRFRSDSMLTKTDSIILKGDSSIHIEYHFRYKTLPSVFIDSSVYYQGRLIRSYRNKSFRGKTAADGSSMEIPIPSKVRVEYDSLGRIEQRRESKENVHFDCSYSYDSLGHLVLKHCLDSAQANRHYREEYRYNAEGKKRLQLERSFSGKEQTGGTKRKYAYDQNDSLIYKSHYRDGKNFLIYKRVFNTEGNLITENVYNDSSGDSTALVLQFYYDYNSSGLLRTKTIINSEGNVIQLIHNSYFSDGNIKEAKEYTGFYDIDGKWIQTRTIHSYLYEYFD